MKIELNCLNIDRDDMKRSLYESVLLIINKKYLLKNPNKKLIFTPKKCLFSSLEYLLLVLFILFVCPDTNNIMTIIKYIFIIILFIVSVYEFIYSFILKNKINNLLNSSTELYNNKNVFLEMNKKIVKSHIDGENDININMNDLKYVIMYKNIIMFLSKNLNDLPIILIYDVNNSNIKDNIIDYLISVDKNYCLIEKNKLY